MCCNFGMSCGILQGLADNLLIDAVTIIKEIHYFIKTLYFIDRN